MDDIWLDELASTVKEGEYKKLLKRLRIGSCKIYTSPNIEREELAAFTWKEKKE